MLLALVILSAAFGYAAFQAGGVGPWDWNLALAGVGLATAIVFGLRPSQGRRSLEAVSSILLGSIVLLTVWQLVPLPLGVIRVLSPLRHDNLLASRFATGSTSAYATLSAVPHQTFQYAMSFERNPWILTWPLLAVGGLQASLGFYQAYAEGSGGFATGTYANRDHFSGLLEMILPFALMYPLAILRRDAKRHESPALPAIKACAIFTVAAVLLIAIIHSLSRMGFMASLASLFICGAIAFTVRDSRIDYQVLPMPLWRRAMPTVVVALIVVAGFILLPTDPLIARFSDFARTEDISADTRAQIWRDTMGMIKSYLWFGCGWGAYESSFLQFKTVAPMHTVDYAHNDYLQVLVEFGIAGFLAGLVFILRLLWKTIRAATYAYSVDERYLAIACVGSITAILLHSLVDFNMYVPANSMLFAWVAGLAGVHLRRSRRSKPVEAAE
jgi:O-antigen ligase